MIFNQWSHKKLVEIAVNLNSNFRLNKFLHFQDRQQVIEDKN